MSDALNAMLARLTSANDGRMLGLYSDGFEVGVFLFDIAGHSRDRATGSDAGNDGINVMPAVFPDLGAGGCFMDRRIRWIFKLLRHPRGRIDTDKLLGTADRACHAFGGWR